MIDDFPVPDRVAQALQDLRTSGLAVLEDTVSPVLADKLLRSASPHAGRRQIRRLWDGTPATVCECLIGRCVFSDITPVVQAEPHCGWRRTRDDCINSGAPRDFIPGLDLIAALDKSFTMQLLPGSARLLADESGTAITPRMVVAEPGMLMVLDSRALRRIRGGGKLISLSVVRAWIKPRRVQEEWIGGDTPERAARFFGRGLRPSTALDDWLVRTGARREED